MNWKPIIALTTLTVTGLAASQAQQNTVQASPEWSLERAAIHAVNPNASRFVTFRSSASIPFAIYETNDPEKPTALEYKAKFGYACELAWSPDGQFIAALMTSSREIAWQQVVGTTQLMIWDVKTLRVQTSVEFPGLPCNSSIHLSDHYTEAGQRSSSARAHSRLSWRDNQMLGFMGIMPIRGKTDFNARYSEVEPAFMLFNLKTSQLKRISQNAIAGTPRVPSGLILKDIYRLEAFTWLPDNKVALVGELFTKDENKILVMDLGTEKTVLSIPTERLVTHISSSKDGRKLLVVVSPTELLTIDRRPTVDKENPYDQNADRQEFRLYNLKEGKEIKKLTVPTAYPYFPLRYVEFSPDDKMISASFGNFPSVLLLSADLTRELGYLASSPTAAKFSRVQEGYFTTRFYWEPSGKSVLITGMIPNPSGVEFASTLWAFGKALSDQATSKPAPVSLDVRNFATISGHTGEVLAIAQNPINVMVATASADRSVRLWENQKPKLVMTGHQDRVQALAWDGIGIRLASAGKDRTIRIWDVKTGRTTRMLDQLPGSIYALAWSPKNSSIAFGLPDGRIGFWSIDESQVRYLEGHTEQVNTLAWNADGSLLASGSDDQTVKIWQAETASFVRTLEGHTGSVQAVAWKPATNQLISASWDKTARIWDVSTGASIRTLVAQYPLQSIAWSPNGAFVATGALGRSIQLWNALDGALIRQWSAHGDVVSGLVFAHDGASLLSSSWDQTVNIWISKDGNPVFSLSK